MRIRRPTSLRVEAIRLTTVAKLTRGLPRQFIAMWEKSRCSILSHLLVAGGKWQTEMTRPVRLANSWSSHFQSLSRDPLLPPASAVINNSFVPG